MSITRTLIEDPVTEENDARSTRKTSARNGVQKVNDAMNPTTDSADEVSANGHSAESHELKSSNGEAGFSDEASSPESTLTSESATTEGAAAAAAEPGVVPAPGGITTTVKEGDPTGDTYDEVPYPGGTYRNTHPCHLAMVARMCGITPTPPRHCRVLELGCSMGANLIPMAQDLPQSEFVGIDLSSRQVKEGQAVIEELGLKNIELRHLSITDVDASFGKFDYIICHGVYSWVPPEVQKAILDIGSNHLTTNGVLYVSYNTSPGWHLRGVVREMMRYHVEGFETPRQKIAQARGLLDFLVKYAKSRSQAYPTLLKEEAQMLVGRLDSYIYHEHLELYNEPVYFHEFV
jgi:2-polyprenyl-3-methyl-5-hydroxy-6-metoxy-1,4-benzoquinol methylase